MLMGTSALASARGKAEQSEILIVGAKALRKALAELPGLGEPIVSAFIMRRERLLRDCEFAGLRIVALNGCRDAHQLDDFLDKNHVPHRLIDAESEEGIALSQRLKVNRRDFRPWCKAMACPCEDRPCARWRKWRVCFVPDGRG